MWSRAQLKDKGKIAFKRNYWKVVLVSAICILLGGGGSSFTFTQNFSDGFESGYNNEFDYSDDSYGGVDGYYQEDNLGSVDDFASVVGVIAVVVIVFLVVVVIAMAISFVLHAFVLNPIEVGGKRFFFKNLNEKASIKELLFAFENQYMNVVKTLFFRDLYVTLWTLLFIVPGIVKSYEYRMMPYLLAENPAMPKEQAFALSKQMMDGQKWKTFVLDLSFIGWEFLSGLTMGLLGIFYVTPYRDMTNAALYESLCYQGQRASYGGQNIGRTTYEQQPQSPVEYVYTPEQTTDNNDEI